MPDTISTLLSPAQRQVYDLLVQGLEPNKIANNLGLPIGVINAQITRIKNRGVKLPGSDPVSIDPAKVMKTPSKRPPSTGGSQNDQIAASLEGNAISHDELVQLASRVAGNSGTDIHPMVLLGCTMQFMKLCGGRMSAHQVIEDVYGAMRMIAGVATPDKGGETTPLPQTEQERLKFLEEQNAKLEMEVARLKGTANRY